MPHGIVSTFKNLKKNRGFFTAPTLPSFLSLHVRIFVTKIKAWEETNDNGEITHWLMFCWDMGRDGVERRSLFTGKKSMTGRL